MRPDAWSSKLANQGRKAIVAAISEQPKKEDMGFTLEAMQMPLEALGYEIIKKLPILNTFEKGKLAEQPQVIEQAENFGQMLANSIR